VKVIVGNNVFTAAPGHPIAVYLDDQDKANIRAMTEDARVYTVIDITQENPIDGIYAWGSRMRSRCTDEKAEYCSLCGKQLELGEFRTSDPDTGQMRCKDCLPSEEVGE